MGCEGGGGQLDPDGGGGRDGGGGDGGGRDGGGGDKMGWHGLSQEEHIVQATWSLAIAVIVDMA